VLDIRDLEVGFHTRRGFLTALHGVDLTLPKGKVTGLVGESGSGKSVTSLSIMRLLGSNAEIRGGQILLDGTNLVTVSEREMERVRGARVSMIFQQPRASLNPVFPVSTQLTHVLRRHRGLKGRAAWREGERMLSLVGLPNPERVMRSYPHELSGGMCQRVMIALALTCDPEVLLADEPTTALDVTLQYQIIELLRRLQIELGLTILLITHDLGLVAEMCDFVSVMYAGRIVESAPVAELFHRPAHPYTRGLMAARVKTGDRSLPEGIPGRTPDLHLIPSGCPFHPRCPYARDVCREQDPAPEPVASEHFVRCHFWREVVA
jgi:oligopeptide/dipeptide ABC transporter ATP-binding protein